VRVAEADVRDLLRQVIDASVRVTTSPSLEASEMALNDMTLAGRSLNERIGLALRALDG
jgi:hypothetical protein